MPIRPSSTAETASSPVRPTTTQEQVEAERLAAKHADLARGTTPMKTNSELGEKRAT